jgi:hypothetical protein
MPRPKKPQSPLERFRSLASTLTGNVNNNCGFVPAAFYPLRRPRHGARPSHERDGALSTSISGIRPPQALQRKR